MNTVMQGILPQPAGPQGCDEVLRLMDQFVTNDPALTEARRNWLVCHLRQCSVCTREYEQTLWLAGVLRRHRPYEAQNQAFLERLGDPVGRQKVIDQGWQDLQRRLPDLARSERRRHMRQAVRHAAQVAACMVLGAVAVFGLLSRIVPSTSAPEQAVLMRPPTVRIEQLSEGRAHPVPAGTEIRTAEGQVKTLLVNGQHHIIQNGNTTVRIDPLVEDDRVGCLIVLSIGEVFARVQHDGNPFVIGTPHGRAVITGTSFDVKVTDAATTLVVVEGSVLFGSEAKWVEVAAGRKSSKSTYSAPAVPTACDAAGLVAWATGHKGGEAVAAYNQVAPSSRELADLWISAVTGRVDLETIDYQQWVEGRRQWFSQEFPWIFQLRAALREEGIEVDYAELLVESGDVWQFAYPVGPTGHIAAPAPLSLLKAAREYGCNEQWLSQKAPSARAGRDPLTAGPRDLRRRGAFDAWTRHLGCFRNIDEEASSTTLVRSLQAAIYLSNTRTLLWLYVQNAPEDLGDWDRAMVLELLRRQVTVVNGLLRDVVGLFAGTQSSSCERSQTLVQDVVEAVHEAALIDEKLRQYEFGR